MNPLISPLYKDNSGFGFKVEIYEVVVVVVIVVVGGV